MTPTAFTLRYLRRSGYLAEVVERWIPGANIRKDLFGIIDLVAITVDEPILGIQATSLTNACAHGSPRPVAAPPWPSGCARERDSR